MDNRRANPRFDLALSLEVHTSPTNTINAVAQNLSVGGLGLAAKQALPEKVQVGVNMFLVEEGIEDSTSAPLEMQAEVVWCTPADSGGFLAGLRFESATEAQRLQIQQFLRRLSGG